MSLARIKRILESSLRAFRTYERSHQAKNTADGHTKAIRNRQFGNEVELALEDLNAYIANQAILHKDAFFYLHTIGGMKVKIFYMTAAEAYQDGRVLEKITHAKARHLQDTIPFTWKAGNAMGKLMEQTTDVV